MNYNHKSLSIFLILFSLNGISAVDNLSPKELLAAQNQGAVIIDIRTPGEWLEGTIPNASRIMFFNQQHKPMVDDFMTEFQKLVTSKDQVFVLVCRSGTRTRAVAKFLNEKLGYTNVKHLEKGMTQWIVDKHEVE